MRRFLALLAVAMPLGARPEVAQAPLRTLTKPDAEYAEPFTLINGVRELRDGRVIVSDTREKTVQILDLWDVGSGVLKSVAFGWAIALVACQRGLATRGGAAGVGLSTTSAVVASLFSLVILDALFTVVFNLYGL